MLDLCGLSANICNLSEERALGMGRVTLDVWGYQLVNCMGACSFPIWWHYTVVLKSLVTFRLCPRPCRSHRERIICQAFSKASLPPLLHLLLWNVLASGL